MSSNHLRIKHSDQENAFKLHSKQENTLSLPSKRPALQPKQNKKQRVPLGGKDTNGSNPFLQRSATTLQQKSLRPSSAPLQKQPSLIKSNSSLGFSYSNKDNLDPPSRTTGISGLTPAQVKNADPLRNDLFSGASARREAELVPLLVSDSPKKTERSTIPSLDKKLHETFSQETAQLHASRIPSGKANVDVDPVKGLRLDSQLLEQLAEDDESVDTVPQVIPLKDEPEDALTEEDLHFIKTGSRTSITENKKLQAELEREHGQLGLSKEDLDELLDF